MMGHVRRYAVGAAIAGVVCLVAGALVAALLNSILAVSYEPKQVAPEPALPVSAAAPIDAIAPLDQVTLPADLSRDPLLTTARETLVDAVATRRTSGSGVTIEVALAPGNAAPEAYAVSSAGNTLRITATGRRGAGNGLFYLADRIASGHQWRDAVTDGTVTPALSRRFVDTGAVGVTPDPAAYAAQDDYTHTSGALDDVILGQAPWVDPAGLAAASDDWHRFIDHVAAYGFNGVVIPGFLEYLTFDGVGDGDEVYPEDSTYRARTSALRDQVGQMWRYAHDMGLQVVFKTDMLAMSPPLRAYLQRTLGGIDANDPRLWQVYQAGIEEFFTSFPWADGLMIRIGEAGAVYNKPGWDYTSELKVTTVKGVQNLLSAATTAAAAHDKTIYLRTWSVGIGEIGDLHTNPQTYAKVMAGVHADNLVVSTKYVAGDFDSYLPLNPTLLSGSQDRIVEFQGRREFEGSGAIPDDMGPAHQAALQSFLAANPRVNGLWLWTQDGGPWRAGPMSLYLKSGFWQLYDLNAYAAARLAWDPQVDLGQVDRDWIARTFTSDPRAIDAVAQIFAQSRSAVLKGFYVTRYAKQTVHALGLEPPPMMWIFKWDIVSGDSAALSAVYQGTRGWVLADVADGRAAIATARSMRDLLAGVDRASFTDPALYDYLAESLDYEVDLFTTLTAYRATFLNYFFWLDTGRPDAQRSYNKALEEFRVAQAEHISRWTGNVDFPPYNFYAADAGLAVAERASKDLLGAWVMLPLALYGLVMVPALRTGAFRPWRLGLKERTRWLTGPDKIRLVLVTLIAGYLSRLSFASALSPAYLLVTVGSLALFAVTARLALFVIRPRASGWWLWSAIAGWLLVRTALFVAVLSIRGPSSYWYHFWVDPKSRSIYVTLAFAAFLWEFVVLGLVMRAAYGVSWSGALGTVALSIAVPVLALGGLLQAMGMEQALTRINDQLAVVPLGLSRILGLTTHLGIPRSIPTWLLVAGSLLALLGAGLVALGRRAAQLPTMK